MRVGEESVLGRLRAFEPVAIGVATALCEGHEGATSCPREALELSAFAMADLYSSASYPGRLPTGIRYLSLHAPLTLPAGGEEELVARLGEIGSHLSAVVVHPHILEQPSRLEPLGKLVALENMDVQKPTGRDVAELASYFEALPEARLCLDVAHVKTVDPTMELGHDLLDAFGERLCELHVSGIDADCNHVTLELADVERYQPILRRCHHVPWILESLPSDSASTSAIHR